MIETSPLPTADVLGTRTAVITVEEFKHWIAERAKKPGQNPTFVTYLNAACSNISVDDPAYLQILQEADCVYADGQAIVWAAKALGRPLPERVNAGDFIVDLCRQLAIKGITVGLIGGRKGVSARAAQALETAAPGLTVAGAWDGFSVSESTVKQIAAASPGILLVGMGVPLQEKWAWQFREQLGATVIWCVGALFEYYGEGRPRAPVWVRRAGLEWLFRLVLEPRRLWRRYLVGNVRFVMRLARQCLSR